MERVNNTPGSRGILNPNPNQLANSARPGWVSKNREARRGATVYRARLVTRRRAVMNNRVFKQSLGFCCTGLQRLGGFYPFLFCFMDKAQKESAARRALRLAYQHKDQSLPGLAFDASVLA